MGFSEDTKKTAFRLAGEKCGSCSTSLTWSGSWHAHHKHAVASGGSDGLSNCKILCVPCHKNTSTYGG